MNDPISKSADTTTILLNAVKNERLFLLFATVAFAIAAATYQNPAIAMWIGFMLAGYSTIANDSIQTIGTFLASNMKRPWWVLWLYIGGIFVVTMTYSWITFDGDVSHQRLTAKGFAQAPQSFEYLQVVAPLFLLILTRLRMPVSTTFLILSCFSASTDGISSVLTKSLSGYFLAFIAAIVVWSALSRFFEKWFIGKPGAWWVPFQWITSGALWMVWLMQDAANIAVYLPRSLHVGEFVAFTAYIFAGLGVLFYLKGDRIQDVVMEKSKVTDIRAATIIDLIYAFILYYFKVVSVVPMSTTWVFLGLLGGREIAMAITNTGTKSPKRALQMIGKDVLYAGIGLLISILLAIAINPNIKEEIFSYF